jgi:IS5 family transposase
LLALIAPHYPNAGRGRRPLPLETMLRVYFLQQWFDLSDPKAEYMLYDSESMRRFARVDLGEDAVPDESTILRFRHLLEPHDLPARIFDTVRALLEDHKLLLKADTIVDATIIAAPSSTKNATKTRDPAMKQTRKGNQWYFGMKVHVGTVTCGLVDSVTATDVATPDVLVLIALVHGEKSDLYGDMAYCREADRIGWTAGRGRNPVNRGGLE